MSVRRQVISLLDNEPETIVGADEGVEERKLVAEVVAGGNADKSEIFTRLQANSKPSNGGATPDNTLSAQLTAKSTSNSQDGEGVSRKVKSEPADVNTIPDGGPQVQQVTPSVGSSKNKIELARKMEESKWLAGEIGTEKRIARLKRQRRELERERSKLLGLDLAAEML